MTLLRRARRLLKALIASAALLVVLILCVTLLPVGTQIIIAIVNQQVPQLQIQYNSGTWWNKIHVDQIVYHQEETKVSADNVKVSMDISCLFDNTLCIRRIAGDSLSITLSTAPQQTKTVANDTEFTLPFLVNIESLAFRHVKMTQQDVSEVDIRQLQLRHLILQNHLKIASLTLDSTELRSISQAPPVAPPVAIIERIKQWQFTPLGKLNIVAPFPVAIEKISVNSLTTNTQWPPLTQIFFRQLSVNDGVLSVTDVTGRFENKVLQAKGHIGTNINAQLKLTSDTVLFPGPPVDELALTANGELQDLQLDATASYQQHELAKMQLQTNLTDNRLPTSAVLRWSQLPLHYLHPALDTSSGEFTLSGDLSETQSAAHISVALQEYPDLHLEWQSHGDRAAQTIQLKHTDWQGLSTDITGQLTLSDALHWRGKLRLNNLQIQEFIPDINASLSGEVQHQLQWQKNQWQLVVDDVDLSGDWLNEALQIQGAATINHDFATTVPNFTMRLGQNNISANAAITANQMMTGSSELSLKRLAEIHPDLSGTLLADLRWSGSLLKPDIDAQITAKDIYARDFSLAELQGKAAITWEKEQIEVEMRANDLRYQHHQLTQVAINSRGHVGEHQIDVRALGPELQITQQFQGRLTDGSWSGFWQSGSVSFPRGEMQLATHQPHIKLNWTEPRAEISAHCWAQQTERLCIDTLRWQENSLHFSLKGHQLKVSSLLPYLIETTRLPNSQSELDFSLSGQWAGTGLPVATFKADITPLSWQWPNQSSDFVVQVVTLSAQTDQQGLRANLHFDSEQLGSLASSLQINNDAQNRRMGSNWQLQRLDLRPWAEFVPALDKLEGFIQGDLQLDYQNNAIKALGNLQLNKGHILLNQYEAEISAIEQEIQLTEQQATISGTFQMGKGSGYLDGNLTWRDDWQGELQLTGEDLAFQNNHSRLTGLFSPDIQIRLGKQKVSLQGTLVVPEALAKLTQIPTSAISPSSDTVIADGGNPSSPSPLDVNIDLKLLVDPAQKNKVNIEAFGLTSALRGDLDIVMHDQGLQALGDLTLIDGHYKAFGQQLLIKQGDILFAGPVDQPALQISAIRDPQFTADNVTAGILVTGSALQPKVEVFSTPDLPQPEALSYLLRGKALSSKSSGSQEDVALNMLLSYGLSKGENLFAVAGDKLGVDDLGVETQGQGDKTKVAVSGSLSPNIKIAYGVGVFDASSEVTVRYDLTKNLYVQAMSGIDSALDIYYQLFFD